MKLSEHIAISKRALKHLLSLDRSYVLCLIFGSVLTAAAPYIPIFFSAKLVDALFAGEELKVLILYVSLTIGLTFLLGATRQFVSSIEDNAQNKTGAAKSGNIVKKPWKWHMNQ